MDWRRIHMIHSYASEILKRKTCSLVFGKFL